jgi:uncharacterized membrane protein YcaP (DUF421 family)
MPQWFEITWRTLLAVLILFFLTKLLGKRQVSQLSLFEYITGITIGSIAAYVSLDAETEWGLGLVSLTVWVACSYSIEYLQIKSKRMRDFIDSKGSVLIEHGRVLEKNLKKERLTTDELMEQLRKKSAFNLADVEFAIMEPSGDINVLLKRENQPLTPKDLGLPVQPEKEPQTVIMDGQILEEALQKSGRNRNWLDKKLAEVKAVVPDVFLAQIDANGELYADFYDDDHKQPQQPKPQPNVELLSALKECETKLALAGVTETEPAAKQALQDASQALDTLFRELQRRLQARP